MKAPKHDGLGNCWAAEAVYDCEECGDAACDVCHMHGEPRGECSVCEQCPHSMCQNEQDEA